MKKSDENISLFNTNLSISNNLTANKSKTTNVNILLNRVRQDKKKDLKKRLIFLSILVITISIVMIFLLV